MSSPSIANSTLAIDRAIKTKNATKWKFIDQTKYLLTAIRTPSEF